MMTLEHATTSTGGGFSRPSKMPCPAYSIPASLCKVGGKLRRVEGSVCSKCYAMKGNYNYPAVRAALARRLRSLRRSDWVDSMVYLIEAEGNAFFRWHDSGDIQNQNHLKKIVEVCERTPNVRHWLPTREAGILQSFINNGGKVPENLTIRLSAHMIDGVAPLPLARRLGVQVSTVVTSGKTCPSAEQGNKCLTCRACWDRNREVVAYGKH